MRRKTFKLFICILCLGLCFTMSGCSKPKKTTELGFKKINFEDISDIESINYVEDAQLFAQINKLSIKNQTTASNSKERAVVVLKYLEDIYELSSTRVSKDLDKIYMYSDTYQDYIAVLQSYCEYYARDIKSLSKNLRNPDFDMDKQPVFIVLGDLEDFWLGISKQLE